MSEFSAESVAFVTGAASGMGLAVARQLILDGCRKVALIDISAPNLQKAHGTLSTLELARNEPPVEIIQVPTDCSQEADVDAAMARTVEAFGRIDVCFNAAGIGGSMKKIVDLEFEEMSQVVGLNMKGVWLCERAEIRQFLKQELRGVSTGLPFKTRGSIVNVGSLTSRAAIPAISPYIMSKHGVLGLTKADALDYAQDGVRVNCVCPGWITTAMTKMLTEEGEAAALGSRLVMKAPMARWGQAEEVAYSVSFLLSDKASFVTGTSLYVDGGYSAC